MTCEHAGEYLDCSASKISRMETARVAARIIDVTALCQLYRADDELTGNLLALAREAKTPGWWQRFDDGVPDWFDTFLGMESVAASIRTYEVQLIPGLLQTDGYARALFEQSELASAETVDRAVEIRSVRQATLTSDLPPQYWAILSEGVLHRMVGGPGVMRDQLLHIAELSVHRHVTIQIIRNSLGAHPGMTTPFVILGFPDRADPQVVYIDYLTGALYLEKPEEVDRYNLAFNHLVASAIPPRQSVELIVDAAKELH
jgi:hypothetical protein